MLLTGLMHMTSFVASYEVERWRASLADAGERVARRLVWSRGGTERGDGGGGGGSSRAQTPIPRSRSRRRAQQRSCVGSVKWEEGDKYM